MILARDDVATRTGNNFLLERGVRVDFLEQPLLELGAGAPTLPGARRGARAPRRVEEARPPRLFGQLLDVDGGRETDAARRRKRRQRGRRKVLGRIGRLELFPQRWFFGRPAAGRGRDAVANSVFTRARALLSSVPRGARDNTYFLLRTSLRNERTRF